MNKKTVGITGIAIVFAIGMIATLDSFTEVSGETGEKSSAPRYSEICAHGHNGFSCKTPQYKVDISELQDKTAELEKRVFALETRG